MTLRGGMSARAETRRRAAAKNRASFSLSHISLDSHSGPARHVLNHMQGRSSSQVPYPQGNTPGPSSYSYAPNVGAFAAQAAAAALSNPYTHLQYTHAPHYAQAYAQFPPPGAAMTADGYTLSSTYVPGSYNASAAASTSTRLPVQQKPTYRGPVQPHWYQSGDCRCSKAGCSFSGSKKAVEIHMMDRHLICPPGWEKRKKKDDWDADPSLKGCVPLYCCLQ